LANRRIRLQNATAKLHKQIDERVADAGFFQSHAGYNAYLNATLRARAIVEGALANREFVLACFDPQRIAAAVREDLVATGGPIQSWPDEPLAISTSLAGLFGAVYVVEGSALGARVLMKQAQALGFTAEHGARHLAAQLGRPTAFRRFLGELEAADFSFSDEREMESAAIATFSVFDRCYAEAPQHDQR